MQLADLRAAAREMLSDEAEPYLWPDALLNRYANNAVREACIRARLLKDDAMTLPSLCVVAVTANQPLIQLAPEILVVRSGMLVGQYHKLWALTAESMDRFQPNWDADTQTVDTPQVIIMDLAQKTIRLWPTPDVAYTLNLRVWRTPLTADLMTGDSSVPVVILPDPEELKHWMAHEAYLKNNLETYNAQSAANHLALFEQRFGARPSLHEMARWADSPPRVRYATMY